MGYGVLMVGYLFLAFADDTSLLIISFLVLGLFPALTDGMQRALASELSTANLRGSALGYVNAISGIGLLLAGVGGGYMWQRLGDWLRSCSCWRACVDWIGYSHHGVGGERRGCVDA